MKEPIASALSIVLLGYLKDPSQDISTLRIFIKQAMAQAKSANRVDVETELAKIDTALHGSKSGGVDHIVKELLR